MASKDPRFNFYPDNWEGGTDGFTLEQEGAYLALCIVQFRRGSFTAAQAVDKLMQRTRGDAAASAALWSFLMPKFVTDGATYWSARLAKEIEKSAATSKKQSEKASKRWHKDPDHAAAYTPAMPPGTGIGSGIGRREGEGMGEETRQLGDQLDAALNAIYLDPLRMKARTLYPFVNFEQELEHFRTKVLGAPDHYRDHDVEGLRMALLSQLKNENSKPQKNGPTSRSNKTADHVDGLVQDYHDRHAAGPTS
jgi:uncharacterized protein YdaU (DUF1376 family)